MTRSVVVAGLLGMAGLSASPFVFQSLSQAAPLDQIDAPPTANTLSVAVATPPSGPIGGVSFSDGAASPEPGLSLGVRTGLAPRFGVESDLNPPLFRQSAAPVRYELAIALPSARTGLGLDLGLASRTTLATDQDGQIARASAGTELRIGRGLGRLVQPWQAPTWDEPTWYAFAASDGQAITWRPEDAVRQRTDGVRWQDRVEVGDFQAGVSLEAGGVQASLSYVERKVNGWGASADENFTGVTVTWRR